MFNQKFGPSAVETERPVLFPSIIYIGRYVRDPSSVLILFGFASSFVLKLQQAERCSCYKIICSGCCLAVQVFVHNVRCRTVNLVAKHNLFWCDIAPDSHVNMQAYCTRTPSQQLIASIRRKCSHL